MTGFDHWAEYPYQVAETWAATPVITALSLTPLADPLPFTPGQYVLLGDKDWRVPQRSFSVANAPRADGTITLLVTLVAGGATSTWATNLQVGEEVLLEGPFGTFVTSQERTGPVLLLGAGSGIAPCIALAESLLGTARQVVLFFSGRTPGHFVFHQQLRQWENSAPNFRYLTTATRNLDNPNMRQPGTRIPDIVDEQVPDLTGWEVFTAGPSGFVTGCEAAAYRLGANAGDVHTEEFFADPTPWTDQFPPLPSPTTLKENS